MMMMIMNQIFLHHIQKNTVQNHLDQIKHPKIQIFIPKTQLLHKITNRCKRKTQPIHHHIEQYKSKTQQTQIIINQHKCKMKSHYPIIYDNTKSQKVKLQM